MGSGALVLLPATSRQTWTVAATGRYDDEILDPAAGSIRPGSLVVDIGASLGLWTVALATAARRAGAGVAAVEPLPVNCEHIRTNLRLNDLDGYVDVHEVALGRAPGEVVLHSEHGSSGNAAVISNLPADEVARHDEAGRTTSVVTARLSTMDEVLRPDQRPVSLVKIDAEGFELEVLAGGSERIARDRPAILGEFSPEWMQSRGVSRADVDQWARQNQCSYPSGPS